MALRFPLPVVIHVGFPRFVQDTGRLSVYLLFPGELKGKFNLKLL